MNGSLADPARTPGSQPTGARRGERGFTLVVVLWIFGLLSLAILSAGITTRTQVAVTSSSLEIARLRAAASAGLNIAIFEIAESRLRPETQGRIKSGATPFTCRFDGDIQVRMWVDDEAGKVNINLADAALLRAAFEGFGLPLETARDAAFAIVAYREPSASEAMTRQFKSGAGQVRPPKQLPFDAVEEIHQIGLVPPDTLAAIMPYLTISSEVRGIDPTVASPILLEALSGRRRGADAATSNSDGLKVGAIPAQFTSRSPRRTYTVTAEARLSTRSAAAEQVTVKMGTARGQPHRVLAWRLVDAAANSPPMVESLTDC